MDINGKMLRVGAAAIACALALRLLGGTSVGTAVQHVNASDLAPIFLFLGTGRMVRQMDIPTEKNENPAPTQPMPLQEAEKRPQDPVLFSQEELASVQMKDFTGYPVDIQAVAQTPLEWDLTQDQPTVLILHTHGSESYENTENYTESSDYRTLDPAYNVISLGDFLTDRLEQAGIRVIHDRTLHDYPSYSGSYEQSRKSVQAYLAEYPSICLVLDIHRDAAEDSAGNQICYTVRTDAGDAAKLMLVVGTNAGGLNHPNWQENLGLAVILQMQLERSCQGICRPISLRTSRFNQDLNAGAVLVEMGAAGNTRQEALLAAEYLANAIIALAGGARIQ